MAGGSAKQIPQDAYLARVAPLYKKGETYLPPSYRPISLLSSVYKTYMCLSGIGCTSFLTPRYLKLNMVLGLLEAPLTPSSLQGVCSRMQQIAEQRGTNLIITLLDWEKDFDRIQHDGMAMALERIGVHQHFSMSSWTVSRTQSVM